MTDEKTAEIFGLGFEKAKKEDRELIEKWLEINGSSLSASALASLRFIVRN